MYCLQLCASVIFCRSLVPLLPLHLRAQRLAFPLCSSSFFPTWHFCVCLWSKDATLKSKPPSCQPEASLPQWKGWPNHREISYQPPFLLYTCNIIRLYGGRKILHATCFSRKICSWNPPRMLTSTRLQGNLPVLFPKALIFCLFFKKKNRSNGYIPCFNTKQTARVTVHPTTLLHDWSQYRKSCRIKHHEHWFITSAYNTRIHQQLT